LIGSRCGPFDKAIALLRDRRVDVRPLIQQSFGLSEGVAAFEAAQKSGALKVLLDPGR
jgi:threonine dehydrogenase-like Zn-dependent dehydrogenase